MKLQLTHFKGTKKMQAAITEETNNFSQNPQNSLVSQSSQRTKLNETNEQLRTMATVMASWQQRAYAYDCAIRERPHLLLAESSK